MSHPPPSPRPGADHTAVAVDTLVGGVHFPDDTPAGDVGYKALAVNLSDLAAMGADATEAVAIVSLPARLGAAWLAAFRVGFESLARAHGVAVAAIDTVAGALSVSVEAHGRCPPGEALTRAGARPGDRIFVSGALGDAGGGLEIALGRRPARPAASAEALLARLHRPAPRLALGCALRGIASAAIDISDGLCQDLGHVLEASGVGARIDADLVPLSPALLEVAGDAAARALALSAGDDYELLFTVPPDRVGRLGALGKHPDALGKRPDTPVPDPGSLRQNDGDFRQRSSGSGHAGLGTGDAITGIGIVEAQPGLRLTGHGGTVSAVPPGYRHFRAGP